MPVEFNLCVAGKAISKFVLTKLDIKDMIAPVVMALLYEILRAQSTPELIYGASIRTYYIVHV